MAGDGGDPGRQGQLGILRPPRRRGRGAGTRDHRGPRRAGRRTARRGWATTRCASPASMRRSWTRRPWRRGASSRCRPLLDAVGSLRDVRDLAAFLGEFEQIGGSGAFGIYVDVDGKNSDRTLQRRPGRPRTARRVVLPRREVRRDPREVRRVPDQMFELVAHDDPAAAASTVLAVETRLSQGHWERAETRDVQKTYNLLTIEELHALCPAFDWEAFIRNLGGSEETIAETASGSRPTSSTSRRPSRSCRSTTGGPGWPPASSAPTRPTSPASSSRPTSTSTAAPSAAPPSCASGGSAGSPWSRARSARRSAASTSPATSRPTPRR